MQLNGHLEWWPRGLRDSLGYFSHVKYFTIDIDIDHSCEIDMQLRLLLHDTNQNIAGKEVQDERNGDNDDANDRWLTTV